MRNPEDTKYVWDVENFKIIESKIVYMNEDDKVIEIMGQKFNQHWAEQLLDVCKTTSVISEEQISLDLPEKYKPEFEEFMRGKTCPILDNGQRGVYSWDFEQYLKTVLRNIKNEKEQNNKIN